MKKLLLLISFLCSCQIGATQTLKRIGVLERKNNTLFIAEGSHRFLVKQEVVTVKLKKGPVSMSVNKNKIRSNRLGFVDLAVPIGTDIESYVSSLEKSRNFEVVEYNSIGEYCLTTNDTEVNRQWYLSSINLFNAWDFTMGNSNTTVAILDSGTDWRHPDLGNGTDGYKNIDETLGWNYITGNSNVITNNGHGTRVAGIVGAKSNNSRGIAGVSGGNNNVGITMIPFCVGIDAPDGSVIDDAIIDAVDRGVRIIQLSLSVGQTNAINAAIEYAHQNNVVVVCATGNNSSSTVSYPASHPNVIAVGGTDKNNRRASFAQYGQNLDVVAPAVDIYSTALNNNYNSQDGTSFSAPQVSGIAALILSVRPDLTGQQVRNAIEQTARKVGGYSYATTSGRPNGTWNQEMGYGLVDAYAAVYAVAPRISGPTSVCNQATYTVENLPPGATVQWSLDNNSIATINSSGVLKKKSTGIVNVMASIIVANNTINLPSEQVFLNDLPPTPTCIHGFANGQLFRPATEYVFWLYEGVAAEWNVTGGTILGGQDQELLNVLTTNNNSSYTPFEVSVRTKNQCGYSQWYTVRGYISNYGNMGPFSLSPNPATDVVTVQLNEAAAPQTSQGLGKAAVWPSGVCEIQLWSATSMLRSYKTDRRVFEIPVSELPAGIYFVRIIDKDGKIYTEKLIKK